MFKLTVYKYLSDRQAVETAGRQRVLIDHLEASAARHGFEVSFYAGNVDGELWKQGLPVGGWHIEKVEA